jgi:cellulose synthase operon protein YhjQ
MTDRRALADQNETPEDVATLYSWANLHGAKYRDFSASRALTREKARQRVQDAIEEERNRSRQEAETHKAVEAQRAMEAAEAQRQAELAQHQAELAQQAAQIAQQQLAQQMAMEAARQRASQQPVLDRTAGLPAMNSARFTPPGAAGYRQPETTTENPSGQPGYRPAPGRLPMTAEREETALQQRAGVFQEDPAERTGRPAWLVEENGDLPGGPPVSPAPEDTLQGSRDRLTSRWFALKGIFENSASSTETAPAPMASRAPVVAVFSLAGGVGKTSLVATLGRALSARGERVLLVDTAAYGLLPFYFGARDQRPGVLRTFSPPGESGDAPLQMLTLDIETLGPENAPQEMLTQQISRYSYGVSRVIVDLATASGATTRRVLRMAPTVLVPVVPDMNSVVSVSSIDAFFHHNSGAAGATVVPYYVLNQFDATLPLHLDVREVLREQLGERLLPLAVRRSAAVSEALAEGMTVMDYAPNSTATEDFGSLAGWLKNLAAPASSSYRGVRWSER